MKDQKWRLKDKKQPKKEEINGEEIGRHSGRQYLKR